MYLILNSNNLICEIAKHPCYVRRQTNSVVILSNKEHADAIYSNDTDRYYLMKKTGYICDGYIMVEVENVPENVTAGYYYHAGQYYTQADPTQELARANIPGMGVHILGEMAKIENALCDIDMAAEERLAEIENALCEIDMGGVQSE